MKPGGSSVRISVSPFMDAGWKVATVVSGILTISLIVVATMSIVWSYDTKHRQEVDELSLTQFMNKEQADVDALATVDDELLAELLSVNSSIYNNLDFLAAALNLSSTNGQSLVQMVEAQIGASLAVLNLRLLSVNGVEGDNVTHNIDLIAGAGITVTPQPTPHTVTLSNAGVLSITALGSGLSFSQSTGSIIASNTGVVSLSGMMPPSLGGNIEILGTGMIDITIDVNASALTVDGSALVTAIGNLQTQNAAFAADIAELEMNRTTLQQEIDNLQMAGQMIAEALNGTTITFNMTLMELMVSLMDAQAAIASLQAQLANVTTIATPSGVMQPWTGAQYMLPSGYLLCDGTEYVGTSYPDLYAVISTMYCDGNCSVGSFRVPDMRGRAAVGQAPSGAFNAVIGTVVGSEQQTLTTPNLPSHTHSGITGLAGDHSHTTSQNPIGTLNVLLSYGDYTSNGDNGPYASGTNYPNGFKLCNTPSLALDNCGGFGNWLNNAGNPAHLAPLTGTPASNAGQYWGEHTHTTDTVGNHAHTVNIGSTGSGTAFSVVQPSVVMQWIIKT